MKPGTSTLPTLPPRSSPTDLLDWLELVEAAMSDLSDGSAIWWKQVRTTSSAAYDKWVVAAPKERLGVAPVSPWGNWRKDDGRECTRGLLA